MMVIYGYTRDEWKFVSMESTIQSVTLAGIIVMLKWFAIKSTAVDTVSL